MTVVLRSNLFSRLYRGPVLAAMLLTLLASTAPALAEPDDEPAPPRGKSSPAKLGELALEIRSAGKIEGSAPDGSPLGFVSGIARVDGPDGAPSALDVILVLDTSSEAGRASGADIDGDGRVAGDFGRRLRRWIPGLSSGYAGPDSVLAAEVAAGLELLARMDPRSARVGVIGYAGGNFASADDAWAQVELTSRFERVSSAIRDVGTLYPPSGTSDLSAGLRMARLELRNKEVGRKAREHVVVVSSGRPSNPRESPRRTEDKAINLAKLLGREGTRVHAYAVGSDALASPRAAIGIAKQSGGRYVPLPEPAKLVSVLPQLDFSDIEELRIRNLTTGAEAVDSQRTPDGSYAGAVALAPGDNSIEVYARTSDGRERREQVVIAADGRLLTTREAPELSTFVRRSRRERGLQIELPPEESPEPNAGSDQAPPPRSPP